MAAHSILGHFSTTSCYYFVSSSLNEVKFTIFGGTLSLSLCTFLLFCKDSFLKRTIRTLIPISFMVSREQELLCTQITN